MIDSIGGRKFFVRLIGIVVSLIYVIMCHFDRELMKIDSAFFTCLGVIVGGFFTANLGEKYMEKKNANIP